MRIFSDNKEAHINNRFLFFIVILFWTMSYVLLSLHQYIKLYYGVILIGIVIFIIAFIVIVLFGREKYTFHLLKRSIFSKLILSLILIAYFISANLIYYQTNQKVSDINLYKKISKDFKNISFSSTLENAILLKNTLIVNIHDKISIEEVEEIIIKKYQNRDDLAFEFKLQHKEIQERSYIIYPSQFLDITINYIVLYLLLFLFIWSLDWTYQTYKNSQSKWRKIKELIGILFVSTFILAIPLPKLSYFYWREWNQSFTYEQFAPYVFSIKLSKEQKYIVILKREK